MSNISCPSSQTNSCEGCPNQSICATGSLKKDPAIAQISEKLQIQHKILILSGKGGVGKSTFTTQLGMALASHSETLVGLLDIDICGPSLPKMLNLENESIHASNSGWSPVYYSDNLSVMSVGFMISSPDEAIIWRGPKKNGLIKQFLRDVDWGELDFLLVDTPPGTSDEHLSIVQYLNDVDGAVLITTPQEVALQDVRKEIGFCRKVGIPILGIVENMSGFTCPKCSITSPIFAPSTGGAQQLCVELDLPFLGSIPIDPRLGKSCDMGFHFIHEYPDSPASIAYLKIIDQLKSALRV